MPNQLQKDIKTALGWLKYAPYEINRNSENNQAYRRLKYYVNEDVQIYCKMEMKALINEALTRERTEIGKSVLKQLLERIE